MGDKPLSALMRDCLTYFRDNEHNPSRIQLPPYTWNGRQMNSALDKGWIRVGPDGWFILSDAGRHVLGRP